jgi:hypothetical protein
VVGQHDQPMADSIRTAFDGRCEWLRARGMPGRDEIRSTSREIFAMTGFDVESI